MFLVEFSLVTAISWLIFVEYFEGEANGRDGRQRSERILLIQLSCDIDEISSNAWHAIHPQQPTTCSVAVSSRVGELANTRSGRVHLSDPPGGTPGVTRRQPRHALKNNQVRP